MGLLEKMFGSYSQGQIKKIMGKVSAVEALADKYKGMSDDDMRRTSDILKARLAEGETLDDILPDAFAAVVEAADRVLGKRPFHVQIIGGVILHQGRIAEMKTGEGKTLVATMPAYLNALTGKGVHVVTVNDYLARRDSEEMGRVYAFLGLTTGLIVKEMSHAERRQNYLCDITYGTNSEFGFDYLRDNIAVHRTQLIQRGHNFAIVDEVDSILIDEARTPLIISGPGKDSSELYLKADALTRTLSKKVIKEINNKEENTGDGEYDYIVDEKANNAVLTPRGIKKVESWFGIENLNDADNARIAHHMNQAIHAYGCKERDVDYVVKDNKVIIVDQFTGRLMPGRQYSNGLHQAIEAKERVSVNKESRVIATITLQNFFRLYSKLSGMTGTALTEEEEFREIYGLDVVEIPTNKPMIRDDTNDRVYLTVEDKYKAIVELVKECNGMGQPVLVGTVSVEKSEILSKMLKKNGIKHNVLNAKHHEREAEIVARAGEEGAVTIATNMAGRGTDIMLGGNPEYLAKCEMRKEGIPEELITECTGTAHTSDAQILEVRQKFSELYAKYKADIAPNAQKVRDLGGLYIIGSERHESRRVDNQLRGRSGRQGDPGRSTFFISLEDDLMRLFGDNRMENVKNMAVRMGAEGDISGNFKVLSNLIENAQKKIESMNFRSRKNVLTYDDVLNEQRKLIYKQRGEVLSDADLSGAIRNMIASSIEDNVALFCQGDPEYWNLSSLREIYRGWLIGDGDLTYSADEQKKLKADDVVEELCGFAADKYDAQKEKIGEELFGDVERNILLHFVDERWLDHIDAMDSLKQSAGLQAYAQRDPVTEYRIVGNEMFNDMLASIKSETAKAVLTVSLKRPEAFERREVGAVREGRAAPSQNAKKPVQAPIRRSAEPGPNEPCPCGSGKKYKKCCALKKGGQS